MVRYPFMPGGRMGQAEGSSVGKTIFGVVALASIGLSAYHGAKRNCGSLGWGFAWGLLGAIFPVVTPVVGFAQGFARPLPACMMR